MSTSMATTDEVRLVDGALIAIRSVDPTDRTALHELLEGLSAQARYLRFLRPLPDIPEWAVDSLSRSDDEEHAARIAITGGGGVGGVAQLFVHPGAPHMAEVAVTIAAPFQRRGLGRILLRALAVEARDRGIDTFTYVASPGNRAAVRVMRGLGATSRFADGLITGSVSVDVLHRRARPCRSPRRTAGSIA